MRVKHRPLQFMVRFPSIECFLYALPGSQAVNISDFSVVRLRSDFVLFSENNYMKALTNQWVWTMPYPPERLAGATRRGHPTAPEAQQPS
jgi:hypothetical protein